jgi:SAM-dependent methyltransferase
MDDIDCYLRGEAVYGDDFTDAQIADWFADEREGYANLRLGNVAPYYYEYHAWNRLHAYRHLPNTSFQHVLGFGSAYGDELLPIIRRIRSITVVDPSSQFRREQVHGVPAKYISPVPNGSLSFEDGCFDLITCFGVLHHIPNVSFVIRELARCLRSGGHMVLREPITSMGDWRKHRPHLTKRERGIPLQILERIVWDSGLTTIKRSFCGFNYSVRLFSPFCKDVYNCFTATLLDAVLSAIFAWNVRYHCFHDLAWNLRHQWRDTIQSFFPTSVYLVLRKDDVAEQLPLASAHNNTK